MKKYTAKKAGTICNRVLSGARIGATAETLGNPWTDDDGRTFVCDGYRAFRLNSAPDGIREVWTVHVKKPNSAALNRVEMVHQGIECMFDALEGFGLVPMPAPDAEAVKAAARVPMAVYDLGEDFPALNARYLRDMIELLPGCRWFVTDGPRRMISPIYAVSNDGAALVLPVRTEAKHHWKSA